MFIYQERGTDPIYYVGKIEHSTVSKAGLLTSSMANATVCSPWSFKTIMLNRSTNACSFCCCNQRNTMKGWLWARGNLACSSLARSCYRIGQWMLVNV